MTWEGKIWKDGKWMKSYHLAVPTHITDHISPSRIPNRQRPESCDTLPTQMK